MRDGLPYFNLAFEQIDPRFTNVGSDEAVMLYTQYSTHWDGFPHKGMIFDSDGVEVEKGDIVCLHTGLGQLIRDADGKLDQSIRHACAVMDGYDRKLLEWIADTGLAAIACDNLAVERSSTLGADPRLPHRAPPLRLPGAAGSPVTPVATV